MRADVLGHVTAPLHSPPSAGQGPRAPPVPCEPLCRHRGDASPGATGSRGVPCARPCPYLRGPLPVDGRGWGISGSAREQAEEIPRGWCADCSAHSAERRFPRKRRPRLRLGRFSPSARRGAPDPSGRPTFNVYVAGTWELESAESARSGQQLGNNLPRETALRRIGRVSLPTYRGKHRARFGGPFTGARRPRLRTSEEHRCPRCGRLPSPRSPHDGSGSARARRTGAQCGWPQRGR